MSDQDGCGLDKGPVPCLLAVCTHVGWRPAADAMSLERERDAPCNAIAEGLRRMLTDGSS
jgi:hypothetical protein